MRALDTEATMSSTMFSSANVAGYAAALSEFFTKHVQNIARLSMVQGTRIGIAIALENSEGEWRLLLASSHSIDPDTLMQWTVSHSEVLEFDR